MILSNFSLDVVVHYDEMMLQQYRNDHGRVKGKLKAVMAFVKELYSERDTLTTELKVNTVAIEHAAGQNWGTTKWRYLLEKYISFFLLNFSKRYYYITFETTDKII